MLRTLALLFALALATPRAGAQCTLDSFGPSITGVGDRYFGWSMDVDGDLAVVADLQYGGFLGAVHVFERVNGAWRLDATIPQDPRYPNSQFGHEVRIDAGTIFVGAPKESTILAEPGQGTDYLPGQAPLLWYRGAVHVFERVGGAWTETAHLVASDADHDARFGSSLEVDGGVLLVGAPRRDVGALSSRGGLYRFGRVGGRWVEEEVWESPVAAVNVDFGAVVRLDGDRALVSSGIFATNETFLYERTPSGWSRTASFTMPGGFQAEFGAEDMAIDGDVVAIGASFAHGTVAYAGEVHVWRRTGGGWGAAEVLRPPVPLERTFFGRSVELADGDLWVSAAGSTDGPESDRGRVHRYRWDGAAWALVETRSAPDGSVTSGYGHTVATDGRSLWTAGRALRPGATPSSWTAPRVHVETLTTGVTLDCACTSGPCGNDALGAGCAHGGGVGARLFACGSNSVAADDLVLRAEPAPAGAVGLLVMGDGFASATVGDGLLCVGGAANGSYRFPPAAASGTGLAEGPGLAAISAASFGPAGTITPGATWRFQFWFRDPQGPCGGGSNLSSAASVTFAP